MDPISIVVLAAYISLGLELLIIAVPSEASTYQLFREPIEASALQPTDDRLQRARRRPPISKLVLYVLPTALGIVLFVIPLGAIFVPEIIGYLVPIRELQTPALQWAGVALVVAGRSITIVSVMQLRSAMAKGVEALRLDGLFAVSRNPGLVGMYAFYVGTCLIFPCVALLLGSLPYMINMHHRVRMEESHLSRALGAHYREYLARVPRYVFF